MYLQGTDGFVSNTGLSELVDGSKRLIPSFEPGVTVDAENFVQFGPPTVYRHLCNQNKDKDDVSDDNESTSMFSDDSYPVHDSLPPLKHYNDEEEVQFFADIYTTLDNAFRTWSEGISKELEQLDWAERYLTLPQVTERNVIFGKCPGNNGFWKGTVDFGGSGGFVHRLFVAGKKEMIPATIIGFIEDFGCRRGGLLFFAIDRCCYYMDTEGDCGEDSIGEYYWGHGPYDLRSFGSMTVVKP